MLSRHVVHIEATLNIAEYPWLPLAEPFFTLLVTGIETTCPPL